ncbi:MAG: Crp/Fnr family transcriptional regulator [Chloroflexi bacterium]|nr:Crp/Fnr family transcriptional regulator [Chloroflexota bacterium]
MARDPIKSVHEPASTREDRAQAQAQAHAINAAEVLSGLSATDAEAVMKLSSDESYTSGDYVYRVEEGQNGVYVVKTGRVEEFRLTPEGQRLPISQIGPGRFFGVSTGQGSYCCFAVAMEKSVVGFFSFEQLGRIFARYPRVGVNLVRWFAHRLGEMEARIEALAFSQLRSRVARSILDLAATQDTDLVEMTQEALAEWVSASRPRVSELLQEFQREGAIHLSRGKIQVQDANQLELWAGEAT